MTDNAILARTMIAARRLVLRPMTPEDLNALHAILIQPGVRRFLFDDRTMTREEVADMLVTSARLFDDAGTGLWAINELDKPGVLVGFVGLWPFHEDTLGSTVSELGFALSESHWGRGLAIEAGAAMLGYARDTLGWKTVQASTDLRNNASIRTLWRLDFAEAGIVPGPNGSLRVFRRAL